MFLVRLHGHIYNCLAIVGVQWLISNSVTVEWLCIMSYTMMVNVSLSYLPWAHCYLESLRIGWWHGTENVLMVSKVTSYCIMSTVLIDRLPALIPPVDHLWASIPSVQNHLVPCSRAMLWGNCHNSIVSYCYRTAEKRRSYRHSVSFHSISYHGHFKFHIN